MQGYKGLAPFLNLGQLEGAILTPAIPVGSAEAAIANILRVSFFLCLILPFFSLMGSSPELRTCPSKPSTFSFLSQSLYKGIQFKTPTYYHFFFFHKKSRQGLETERREGFLLILPVSPENESLSNWIEEEEDPIGKL